MQTKSFSYKNLITIFVTLMLLLSLTFTFSTAKADTLITDYTNGGYVDIEYGETLIHLPEGVTKEERSKWKQSLVEEESLVGGWYRVEVDTSKFVETYETQPMFFNLFINQNGEKISTSVGYSYGYEKIILSRIGIECDTWSESGKEYYEFFIPSNFNIHYKYGNYLFVKLDEYSSHILRWNYSTVYKLTNESENIPQNKTTIENLKIGSTDTLDRSNYITSNKDTYSLANRWFRFKKPSNTTRRTFDIANVSTTLDGKDYNAKLYYVEDDNGNESLWLGRFNVTYREVVINNETYIEFSIPKSTITYYNTEEAIITHTLKVGIMDTIKPIDDTLVGIEYNFVKSVQEDFATNSPYSSIIACLGGVALLSIMFLITMLIKENKQNKE